MVALISPNRPTRLPPFKSLLQALSDAWTQQNADITQSADALTEHLNLWTKSTTINRRQI